MNSQQVTLVQVEIPNVTQMQPLVTQLPASLTLLTPSANIQIEVKNVEIVDIRQLPESLCSY